MSGRQVSRSSIAAFGTARPAGQQTHPDRHCRSYAQVISQIFYVDGTLHANAVGTSVHLKQVTYIRGTH